MHDWSKLDIDLSEPDVYWGQPADLSSIKLLKVAVEQPISMALSSIDLFTFSDAITGDLSVSTSEGWAIHGRTIAQYLEIPKTGRYDLNMRLSSNGYTDEEYVIYVDSLEYRGPLSPGFSWIEIPDVMMYENAVNITLSSSASRVYLDQIMLIESNIPYEIPNVTLSSQKINPAKYRVSGNSSGAFSLFFSERFSSSWVAKINDEESYNLLGYSFGNVFYINQTGTLSGIIRFNRLFEFNLGKTVAFSSFVLVLIMVKFYSFFADNLTTLYNDIKQMLFIRGKRFFSLFT